MGYIAGGNETGRGETYQLFGRLEINRTTMNLNNETSEK